MENRRVISRQSSRYTLLALLRHSDASFNSNRSAFDWNIDVLPNSYPTAAVLE